MVVRLIAFSLVFDYQWESYSNIKARWSGFKCNWLASEKHNHLSTAVIAQLFQEGVVEAEFEPVHHKRGRCTANHQFCAQWGD